MNTLRLKQIIPTGETFCFVKWRNKQNRWVFSEISSEDYSALSVRGIPKQPQEYDGENWEQEWLDGKIGAGGDDKYFNTESGHVEPGSIWKFSEEMTLIFTDDAHNGTIIELTPNEYTGEIPNITTTVEIPGGFNIVDGILTWQ